MASVMHLRGKKYILDNGVIGPIIRAMLMNSTYVPNQDTEFVDTIDGDEVSGMATYSRKTIAGTQVNIDFTGNKVNIDCNDIAWGNLEAGSTPGWVVLYVQLGGDDTTPADDVILCSLEFTPTPTNGQSYTTTIAADGFAGDP
jgi:hypothetical protein